jgi:hypothetical protein
MLEDGRNVNARHWVADFDVATTTTRQEIAKQYETESGYEYP